MYLRTIFKWLLTIGLIASLLCAFVFLYFYFQEKPFANKSYTPLPTVTKATRLLVFAPHCDDETLGCGAIIYDTLQAGGQVQIVFVTNGDGFTLATHEQFHRVFVSADDYIQSGYTRQRESLHALAMLGVPEEQILFLGYPDRGIRPMWETYWDDSHPYKSRFTNSDHSPYPNSYEPNTPYAGHVLYKNIKQILAEFQPTTILLPHASDEHPDHLSTAAFVLAVIAELTRGNRQPIPDYYMYLVHRGDYPIPHGYLPQEPLLPPKPLAGDSAAPWYVYTLDAPMEDKKYQSLKEYKSQFWVPVMHGLLQSFVRTNELFYKPALITITPIPSNVPVMTPEIWGSNLLIQNPVGVNPLQIIERAGIVSSVYGGIRDRVVWLRLHIPGFEQEKNMYTVSYTGFHLQDDLQKRDQKNIFFTHGLTGSEEDSIFSVDEDVFIKINFDNGLPDFFFIRILTTDKLGIPLNRTVWQPILLDPQQLNAR